ncbi:MAG: hypothetical protein K2G88_01005, partial [Oscillospiraceae bacterium]|nr:hypothetical protein [Oscillospiraceae bacterium]
MEDIIIDTFDDDLNDENYHLIYNKFINNIYLLTMAKNLQQIKKCPLLTFQQKSFSNLWSYFMGMTSTFMFLNDYTEIQFQSDYKYYNRFITDFNAYMKKKYVHKYKNWRSA